MALSYGFFDAELTPSGQYDRAYAAEQFAEYFHLIVSNGVFPDPATQLQVVASDTPNMNVNVSDGYGWINGYYAKNSGPYPLAIQAASGTLNRIDAVVLRWVNASRSMELVVKTGIAASSPATPALQRDTDVYELMLATVTVAAGVTSITQSSITDKRSDTSVCGWVTGAVQNIDTTNLFAQYDTAFQEWFDSIKSQLSGDVATNLQNQINKNAAGIANINATTLKADTKTALGLPDSAGPDDAFKVLAHVGNLHVWERVQTYAEPVPEVPAGYTLGPVETDVVVSNQYASSYNLPFDYATELNISSDGTISLKNPSTREATIANFGQPWVYSNLAGHFFVLKSSVALERFRDVIWYMPEDGTASVSESGSVSIVTLSKMQSVSFRPYAPAIPAGTTTDYLTSTDRNAYTDGTVGNTTITYLDQLGGGARIEVGSYVGTGTYGSSNPIEITFSFEPKIILFGQYKNGGYPYSFDKDDYAPSILIYEYINTSTYENWGAANMFMYARINKGLKFYARSSNAIGNVKGTTYYLAAIG